MSVWDVLGGQVEPGAEVLVYDDHGDHQGPSVVDFLATRGSAVELVTPDRMAAHDVGATNYPVYLQSFYSKGVRMTPDHRLRSVERDGNRLRAVLRNEYNDVEEIRVVDQVVVEHGTLPAAELFHELAPMACNEGELDIDALVAGRDAGDRAEQGGRVHAVPGRRRGGEPEYPRGDLRLAAAVQGVLRAKDR